MDAAFWIFIVLLMVAAVAFAYRATKGEVFPNPRQRLASMTPKRAAIAMVGPLIGLTIGGALLASTGSINWGYVAGILVGLPLGMLLLLLLGRWARRRQNP